MKRMLGAWLVCCGALMSWEVYAAPCLIFVHGKQTDTNTFTSWTAARDYWKNGSDDFIQTATKNFATDYYVVGYNGSQAYWDADAAGHVANEIVAATNGTADGGGNSCGTTYAQVTTTTVPTTLSPAGSA